MAAQRVVVQGSLRPFLAAGASAVLLGALGVAGWRGGGASPGTVLALGLAALAGAVLLLDLPRWTEAGPDGLVRVCLLRRERIGWDRVVAVERQRRRLTGPGTGGLVLRGRRGRWLLATSAEPPAVHAGLARLLADHAPQARMQAEPPAVTTDRR
jgi:hypothetical protein